MSDANLAARAIPVAQTRPLRQAILRPHQRQEELAGHEPRDAYAVGVFDADEPVLLLAGERDLSTPLACARAEAAQAPDGRLVVVPGAGHSVQLRARDPAVGRILTRSLGQ